MRFLILLSFTTCCLNFIILENSLSHVEEKELRWLWREKGVWISGTGLVTIKYHFIFQATRNINSYAIHLPKSRNDLTVKDIKVYKNAIKHYSDKENILLKKIALGDIIEYEFTVLMNWHKLVDIFFDKWRIDTTSPVSWSYYHLHLEKEKRISCHIPTKYIYWRYPEHNNSLSSDFLWVFKDITPKKNPIMLELSLAVSWHDIEKTISDIWNNSRCKNLHQSIPIAISRSNSCKDAIKIVSQLLKKKISYRVLATPNHLVRPDPCNVVWERGWGDCKDLTLLMVYFLGKYGYKAYPVILPLELDDTQLPSILPFRHAIVACKDKGETIYYDPSTHKFLNIKKYNRILSINKEMD